MAIKAIRNIYICRSTTETFIFGGASEHAQIRSANMTKLDLINREQTVFSTQTENDLYKTKIVFEMSDDIPGRLVRQRLLMQNNSFIIEDYSGSKTLVGRGSRPYPQVNTSFPENKKTIIFEVSFESDKDNLGFID